MALTDEEFGLLQTSIDAMLERLAQLNLSIVVERDFNDLVRFLRSKNAPLINPTYDPEFNDLSRNAFWMRVIDESGETVASHAQRMFETEDFCELVQSGRLWYDHGMTLGPGQEPIRITRPPELIRGIVAHAGALWVEPRRRKIGLSMYLPFLSRVLSLRNYNTDYYTCIVDNSMARSIVPTLGYGYPHMQRFFDGWTPPANRNLKDVHICWMSQAETIEQFRRLPKHPLFPLQLTPERIREAINA